MTHTPGPWKVQALHVEGQEIILRTHGEMTIGAPEAYAVASVPLRHVSINGQLANARLIAAAPDMLDALHHCYNIVSTGILHQTSLSKDGIIELLKDAQEATHAAIAQAEGRI